jgi:hypothetical protein
MPGVYLRRLYFDSLVYEAGAILQHAAEDEVMQRHVALVRRLAETRHF